MRPPSISLSAAMAASGADGAGAGPFGGAKLRNTVSAMDKTILEAGTVLGKYKIIDEIGRGGMAVVYKALQLGLNRQVALKVMPANVCLNTRFVERFLSEAHSVAKLNHPNIVNVYEASNEGNTYYIAMEYIAGKNLYQYLNEAKPKLIDVLEIVAKLAEALHYAHDQKIIHRDLKLGNVLMKDPLTPILIDFGLAKALEESDSGGGITRTGEIMGSPAYMAPERLMGQSADHRSDICSLGIMLYEMLTFKNPYLDQRNLHQTTYNVMEANPLPPRKLVPWLPAEVEAVTLKAMAKDPDMRYNTMNELRDDLRRYQRGDAVRARPASLKNRIARKVQKRRVPIVISAIVLLFCGILGLIYFAQMQRAYSNWQLVYSQPDRLSSEDWILFHDDSLYPGRLEDGHRSLTLSSPGLSYIVLDNRFNRDILIEFDVRANRRNLNRAGAFILGESPESGYAAHINRDGFGASGLTFPNGEFLFTDVESGQIRWREVNSVAVERSQNVITMTVNGVLVSRVFDYFRPIGRGHEQVGFFVNAAEATFSNIKIYRRAIPQTPSPILIANRFLERGDFESALEEYMGLLVDQSTPNLVHELHVNIAECLIRLGRYDEAISRVERAANLQGTDHLRGRAVYLGGVARLFSGDTARADSAFAAVAERYGAASVTFSIMARRIAESFELMADGDRDGALAVIETGAAQFPRWSAHWGRRHLQLLDREARLGNVDRATQISARIAALHEGNVDMIVRARIALAGAYLNMGQTQPALDIYNQTIYTTARSESVRQAWFALAELYEYEFDYNHAATIYSRLLRESVPPSATHWMALLKSAEHAARASGELRRAEGQLNDVVNGVHPYAQPRIIAQYYLNQITEIEFLNRWDDLFPGDPWSLYYVARKLLLQGNRAEAFDVMRVLQRQMTDQSWRSFKVTRVLHNQERWN